MTAVKICGLRDAANLTAAIDAGADFVGLVFYPPSPRAVTPRQASELIAAAKGRVKIVGLFVDPEDEDLKIPGLDIIQLHGDETPARVQEIKALTDLPVMKALRIAGPEDLSDISAYEEAADWLMFDAKASYTPPPSLRGEAGRGVAANAKTLRKTMTDAEILLWKHLSRRQVGGYKFRRQHPIPPYIADFACLEEKLIVELDGSQHAMQEDSERERTAYLNSHGYNVVRFWNNEVIENIEGVLQTILDKLQNPPPLSSPLKKGGGNMSLPGGTGQSFDWNILAGRTFSKPWMLAGGLRPENVATALSTLKPDAVDVSSGVESAPGQKDPDKIRAFIEAVKD